MKNKIKKKITKGEEFERAWDLKINYLLIDDYTQSHLIDNNRRHPYHIVENSPWPFRLAISLFFAIIGFVFYMNNLILGGPIFLLALFQTFKFLYFWFSDVIDEGTFSGHHTVRVQKLLKWGMALFILSEVMFFFGFFWAFFHSSICPSILLGSIWPPVGITVIPFIGYPFFNTVLLIVSGFAVTWAHRGIALGSLNEALDGLCLSILLGFVFLFLQIYEYNDAYFNISDGVYASTFYMLTGLHGCHVLVGVCFLIVNLIRLSLNHFTTSHYLGFVFSIWYWHFVDIVWIGVFIIVYWWGGYA